MTEHVRRGGISAEVHRRLLEEYRRSPGHARSAGKAAGCDPRTAKKAWEHGWPHLPYASRPLRDVIGDEEAAARALREQHAARVTELIAEKQAADIAGRRSLAATDAVATRAGEALLVKAARGAAAQLIASLATMNAGLRKSSARIAEQLVVDDAKPATVADLLEVTQLTGNLAAMLSQAVATVKTIMDMERLVAGEPWRFQTPPAPEPISQEEAERRIALGVRALERAKAKGIKLDT